MKNKKDSAMAIVKVLAKVVDGPVSKGYTGNCWLCGKWVGNYMRGSTPVGPFAKNSTCINKGLCKASCPGNRARRLLRAERKGKP
jgi:hypothetical protein